MHLQDALSQIGEIRRGVVRTQQFEGIRPSVVFLTGLVGLLAGGLQAVLFPTDELTGYEFVGLWVMTAIVNLCIGGFELIGRSARFGSPRVREQVRAAVRQFLPTLITGASLTLVVCTRSSESIPLLPGLWACLFGLGLHAAGAILPPKMRSVATFYVVAGLFAITFAADYAFSPWVMAGIFGGGQLMTAVVLARDLGGRNVR